MIRHPSHRFVGRLRSLPPRPTEREYSHASFEITPVRDYSPINHCFYLLLLTFIDILENPVPALGPRADSQNETRLTQRSGQVSMHQQDRGDRGSIFWYKSHFVSKCLTEEVESPNFAKFDGCPAAKDRDEPHPVSFSARDRTSTSSSHTLRNAVWTGGSDRLRFSWSTRCK
jgi:hypothetical protein